MSQSADRWYNSSPTVKARVTRRDPGKQESKRHVPPSPRPPVQVRLKRSAQVLSPGDAFSLQPLRHTNAVTRSSFFATSRLYLPLRGIDPRTTLDCKIVQYP